MQKILVGLAVLFSLALGGCVSVPMAPTEQDLALKEFKLPAEDESGLYVYRNCFGGAGLKKLVTLDGKVIGQTVKDVFFHKFITPGSHVISTESEFSDNSLTIKTDGGKNYFIEQYIKLGIFVDGANLRLVDEEKAKKAMQECHLAKSFE